MLKNNARYSPFMGDNRLPSVGLNPLGIRTASEQLFTTLLPGLNVVTLRIRYYSFYCWLLQRFYDKREQANLADLRQYIRKSELLMALIHAQSRNGFGVPGITRAFEILGKKSDYINFNEDAMPDNKPSGGYWKGPLGAFGTYYAASLQELGIIRPLVDNPSLYNITLKSDDYISGEELADAFTLTIGDDNGELFEECAKNGEVSLQQLSAMASSFQTHNLNDNKECDLLLRMLLQKDRPATNLESNFRRDTIHMLLNFFKEEEITVFSEIDFAEYVYKRYSAGNEKSEAAVGWFDFYLNDRRQFEALNIFEVILERLMASTKPGQWEYIETFTAELADEVCSKLDVKDMSVNDVLNNWQQIKEPSDKISHSFYVMLDDYINNRDNMKICKEAVRKYFKGVTDDALDAFETLSSHLNDSMYDYAKTYITEDIIYKHYSESMRKYSQNGVPTQKLTIENGYVRGLSSYEATHSSPRIDTLRNYITDLGLISGYSITEKGCNLLNKLIYD